MSDWLTLRSGVDRRALLMLLAVSLKAAAAAPTPDAGLSRRQCEIEDHFEDETKVFHAECFDDVSKTARYWLFAVQPLKREPDIDSPPDDGQPLKAEPIPHRTIITGSPKVWAIQKAYRGSGGVFSAGAGFGAVTSDIGHRWETRQAELEELWRKKVYAIAGRAGATPPKLVANRTSPFFPLFRAPAETLDGASLFLPEGFARMACERAEPPGCETRDPPRLIEALFKSWVITQSREASAFPPSRVDGWPGSLNLETLRVPLYRATRAVVWSWSEFWGECWAASSAKATFDGCQAELSDYLTGPALSKASAKKYPTMRLTAKALAIAEAIDSARTFEQISREAISSIHPDRWMSAGVEPTHLEPDDLPAALVSRMSTAQVALEDAVRRMGAYRPPE